MKRYAMTVNLETGATEMKEVDPSPEPVFLSRPRRSAPDRPPNWWHGRRKSTRRK